MGQVICRFPVSDVIAEWIFYLCQYIHFAIKQRGKEVIFLLFNFIDAVILNILSWLIMNLNHFGDHNQILNQLLHQSAHWLQLNRVLKQYLPANLHSYFQAACVNNGCLIVFAANSMAASRLRMMLPALLTQLNKIDNTIQTVRVKIQPPQSKAPVFKHAPMSTGGRQTFAQAAQKLPHHPELAAALLAVSQKSNPQDN